MEKVSRFIREELSGWKLWEVVWLFSACAVIAALSVYWHDTVMGIVSATTGVACVVCTGKGKLSAYIFGAVWVVITFMFALIALSLDNTAAFIAGAVLLLLGGFVLFFDKGKKKVIRAFIESL